jgi:hypothetical protein
MKGALKAGAAILFLGGAVWVGGYLYWHIRLLGAIRALETRSGPQGSDSDAAEVVRDAGCKALPYLIGAIQPARNPFFLVVASDLLKQSLQGPMSRGDVDLNAHLADWMITTETSTSDRQRKCDELHAWWRDKGQSRHSGAAWWKQDCGGI